MILRARVPKNKMHVSTFSILAIHDFLDFMNQCKGKLYMMKMEKPKMEKPVTNNPSGIIDLYRLDTLTNQYSPLIDFYFYSNEYLILNRLPQFQNNSSDSTQWEIVPAFCTLDSPFDFEKCKNVVMGCLFTFNTRTQKTNIIVHYDSPFEFVPTTNISSIYKQDVMTTKDADTVIIEID